MTFNDYQAKSKATVIYPNPGKNFVYPAFGVAGEAGEIADVVKRIVRDKQGVFDGVDREMMKNEIGDLLWYASQLASEFGLDFDNIAANNLNKLNKRQQDGKLRKPR